MFLYIYIFILCILPSMNLTVFLSNELLSQHLRITHSHELQESNSPNSNEIALIARLIDRNRADILCTVTH
jgi:hypothetical protein